MNLGIFTHSFTVGYYRSLPRFRSASARQVRRPGYKTILRNNGSMVLGVVLVAGVFAMIHARMVVAVLILRAVISVVVLVAFAGEKAAGGGQQGEAANGKQYCSHGINPAIATAFRHGVFSPAGAGWFHFVIGTRRSRISSVNAGLID
jgi:hypothetical protein